MATIAIGSVVHARNTATAQVQDEWMALLINGQKSGFLHHRRQHTGHGIKSTEHMQWNMQRGGVPLRIEMTDTTLEKPDGTPVSFSSEQKLSSIATRVSGRIEGDTLTITKSGLGPASHRSMPWKKNWLMNEGYRQAQIKAFQAQGMQPGSRFSATVFVPSLEKAVTTTSVLGEIEAVDLLGQTQRLWHVTETTDMGFIQQLADAWVDDQFNVKKMRLKMMGMTLEMIACPKACATADSQPFEAFADTLARVPVTVPKNWLTGPLHWELRLKTPVDDLQLAQSHEQSVRIEQAANGQTRLHITVSPEGPATADTTPATSSDDLSAWKKPTPWLQSNANLIVGLAKKTVRANQNNAEKMQAITDFVRHYIRDKNLSVAYASALETAKYRNGDCTEHALLTAAMGRAVGIPTRIATGLVYVPDFQGQKNRLIPHAWTQAWVNGRWHSFDAALGQFDSGHIALNYGDGDPTGFYNGIQLLGNLEVNAVTPATKHTP
jgi:hypothetical protein